MTMPGFGPIPREHVCSVSGAHCECVARLTRLLVHRAHERDEALRHRDELRALLREVEWGIESDRGIGLDLRTSGCPWCGQCESHGHATDCRIDAALEGR